MAVAKDYGLGPQTFPWGWFVVAESAELNQGSRALRFFGCDLALYRGESGRPVLLDAYCDYRVTHLAASDSAMIARTGYRCLWEEYHPRGDDIKLRLKPIPEAESG